MSGVAPYLIVFSLSVFLFWLSQKTKGSLCFILVACALLIPSLLAGFRDNSVGTDVMVYGYYSFRGALESGLQEYLISSASYHPLGFNLFSWVMARLGGTLWFYLACSCTWGLSIREALPFGLEWQRTTYSSSPSPSMR